MDESVVREFEQQRVGLRPSQLLRIGAKLRPQCFDVSFYGGGSCALGAIYEASTGRCDVGVRILGEHFKKLIPPNADVKPDEIILMNDLQRMSREAIADWLEEQGL